MSAFLFFIRKGDAASVSLQVGIFNPVGHTVKADENDKNFQPPQKHACHLHYKRGIV